MARQDLKGQPTVLANLTEDVAYTIQNRSDHTILVQTAAAPPTTDDHAFTLASQEYAAVRKESGEEIYVWTQPRIDSGYVVYEEEA